MRKFFLFGLLVASSSFLGCARPNEIGWTPAYTSGERGDMIARNWDMEGKFMQDDIDHALLLRPMSNLSTWHVGSGLNY